MKARRDPYKIMIIVCCIGTIIAVMLGAVAVINSVGSKAAAEAAQSSAEANEQTSKNMSDLLTRRNISIEQGNARQEQDLCVNKVEAEFLSSLIDYALAENNDAARLTALGNLIRIQAKLDDLELECPLKPLPPDPPLEEEP